MNDKRNINFVCSGIGGLCIGFFGANTDLSVPNALLLLTGIICLSIGMHNIPTSINIKDD